MKPIFTYLLLLISIITNGTNFKVLPKDSVSKDSLMSYSKSYLGTNYCYGSCEPKKGFDCSGFVYHIYNHFNVKVPRSSIDYINHGKTIHPDSFKIGDVIVFTGTNSKNRKPGYVGIITSNAGEELQFIHSSSNKKHSGIKLSTYKESPYYEKRFLKIVRVTKAY